jgi:multicomponent Na+:H+ antiporter subunit D
VFWGEPQPPVPDVDPTDELLVGTARTSVPMYAATAGLVAASLAIAAFAGPLAGLTERAGADLLDREPYRVAVLGEGS